MNSPIPKKVEERLRLQAVITLDPLVRSLLIEAAEQIERLKKILREQAS